jgi:hypothetical protein
MSAETTDQSSVQRAWRANDSTRRVLGPSALALR